MEIENKTLEILDLVREKVLSPDEALPHILRLFSVVGRSEQLLAFFEHIQREYNIEADITFGEALQSFKSK
jgi:hypothetical protein